MQIPATDLFATKGIEYLLVVGFLLMLVPFWRFLVKPHRWNQAPAPVSARARPTSWFHLEPNRFYHPGHSWVLPSGREVVTVGIDDFIQKLVGAPSAFSLPAPGTLVRQGEVAFTMEVDSRPIEVLSPVDGEITQWNEDLLATPDLMNRDPYDRGWFVKVKPARLKANLRSLLQGDLASAWLEKAQDTLQRRTYGDLGVVMQDGGLPDVGMARRIAGDEWENLVRAFLLTRE